MMKHSTAEITDKERIVIRQCSLQRQAHGTMGVVGYAPFKPAPKTNGADSHFVELTPRRRLIPEIIDSLCFGLF